MEKLLFNDYSHNIHIHLANNGNEFKWNDTLGIGRLPANNKEPIYHLDYWDYYVNLRNSDIGIRLTAERVAFSKEFASPDKTLDIGIGNGQFVEMFNCRGYDINPFAIEWLKEQKKLGHPRENYPWWTMFDVLEHLDLHEISDLLKLNKEGLVITIPIVNSFKECLVSKMFRPNEHVLYFTEHGLHYLMNLLGYHCVKKSDFEHKIRGSDVCTFAFKRLNTL